MSLKFIIQGSLSVMRSVRGVISPALHRMMAISQLDTGRCDIPRIRPKAGDLVLLFTKARDRQHPADRAGPRVSRWQLTRLRVDARSRRGSAPWGHGIVLLVEKDHGVSQGNLSELNREASI